MIEKLETNQRIAKNTSVQIVTYGARALASFLIVLLIARLAGPESLGVFSLAITFTAAATFLADLGLGLLLVREISREPDETSKYVGNSLALMLVTGPLVILIMFAVATVLNFSPEKLAAIFWSSVALVLFTYTTIFKSAFHAREQMENETITIVIQESIFLIMGVAVLYSNVPFVYLFVVYAFSRLVGLVVAALIYRLRFDAFRLQFDWSFLRELLIKSWPFAVGMVLNIVYARSAILMLSYYQGDAATGYYEAAYNPALRLVLLIILLNGAMMPILSRSFNDDSARFQGYVNQSLRYALIIGIPISLCLFVLADSIIVILYGAAFSPGVLVFRLISLALVFKMVGHSCATSLTASNRQGLRALSIGIVAVVNIILNIYLIPRFSYSGAGMATLATEILLFVLFAVFAWRSAHVSPYLEKLWKPIVAAVPMIGILVWFQDEHILLAISLSLAVYLVSFTLLRGFSAGEVSLVRRLLAGSRQLTS